MSQSFRDKRPYMLIASTLVFLFFGTALAEESKGGQGLRKRGDVKKTVKLKPHPKAEVIIPDFNLIYLLDGSVNLSGSGSGNVDSSFEGYDFEIDPKEATYMTRRLSEAEIRGRLEESIGSEGLEPITEEYYEPGPYRVHAYVQTKDPVSIVLTETSTKLEWSVSSTGSIVYRWAGDRCWHNAYTEAGTTWYTDYCDYGDLWWATDRSLCNDTEGWYYNYDYMYDHLITNAYGQVFICGQNDGNYRTGYKVSFSGEDSGLLRGSFYHYRYYTNM
jgi:hypothetical protein